MVTAVLDTKVLHEELLRAGFGQVVKPEVFWFRVTE